MLVTNCSKLILSVEILCHSSNETEYETELSSEKSSSITGMISQLDYFPYELPFKKKSETCYM